MHRLIKATFFLLFAWPSCSYAQTRTVDVSSRAELIHAATDAKAGAVIRLASGAYAGGIRLDRLSGNPESPIVIKGLDPKKPPVIEGGDSGIQLSRSSYVEIRDLVIQKARNNGLNIDDGGQSNPPASNIRLQRITIRDVGSRGNHDGIKMSGVDQFQVLDCTVERWGESGSAIDMVGCHHGEIKGCQFKYRGDLFANGVQTKGGSSDIAIRRCLFDQAGGRALNIGGSTGKLYYRPPSPGFEAKDITVEDCSFIGSLAPVAFVGVDGAVVRHNVFFRPGKWVIRILQENQQDSFVRCRNGRFENNVIVFTSDKVRNAVNIGAGTSPETFRFANNHWYCSDRPDRSSRLGLPVKEINGVHGVDPKVVVNRSKDRLSQLVFDREKVKEAGVRKLNGEIKVERGNMEK